MGSLLARLGLPPIPQSAKAAGGTPASAGAEPRRRLDSLTARVTAAGATGAKVAPDLKKRVADAEAAIGAAATGDKSAVDKAHRAVDVVQMVVHEALPAAGGAAGQPAKPAQKYVPSPEAVRFTKHVKVVMGKIAMLEAAKSPDAQRLKKAAIEAAKLGQHSKSRAMAMAQLQDIEKQVAQGKADADKSARRAAAPKEQLYNMKVGSRQLTDATKAQVCVALKKQLDELERALQGGFESHCEELKIAREEPFAAWISQGVSHLTGGQDMPELEIWDDARDLVIQARHALKREDIDALVPMFPLIARSTKRGISQIKKYNADVIEAAGQVVEVAKKTEDVAATVISKSAEKMGGKGVGVAAGSAAKALFQAAEEWSAVNIAKTKKKIDWGAVAKEGVANFVSELVGLLLHGFMAEKFSGFFGAYLKKASFSEKELLEMGKAAGLTVPLPRDYFTSTGQKLVKDFLMTRAENLVKGVVEDLIKSKKESDPSTGIEEFVKKAAAKLAEGKAIDLFAEFVVEHAAK